ncbi:MAG: hypothetical protein A3I44_00130 [Candidatus Sungbacteria bacterium RIFCSPLOWO2_02_FULL_51_17]|uniref:Uncharacterized protein n=1 Tax=Candidatus Sungbacteria bacterium RIFCSPHIGHO2_02_FULL_51_29 TaxID=1802273 RepID=A0A1G2KTV5_9BACT|nr:MAG: hypothetical protein A2676_05565 [Candidatus Sungbacteria bacterium RIFCSPHIGHO2_01_FULL_51_22]OHA02918.1 MAG: hypothetical protein A3C16_04980 [Candidatus Sungbacteria bacterium RIFCSPHIGHO2_02_FULL_51_29]OHA06299.1 MAG: hypothetical protein A3B29_03490 [Candidatus Sungbacteria bacterium RIFCSPLOWO2_01_FULL_51_34]OHA11564.1 MAG: hypothetical protein A3I44_00130 [Candidatus Sungbacteria bacterium RIFCSPLOWO2_02_FULL_51_17]
MKRRTWRFLKVLVPILVLYYIEELIRPRVQQMWYDAILYRYGIFSPGPHTGTYIFLASILLTGFFLIIGGYLIDVAMVKRCLNAMAEKIPWFGFFWSDDEEQEMAEPVEFECSGDGRGEYKIFYVTGIGDHMLIPKERAHEKIRPLTNSQAEIAKMIASCMSSGPRVLMIKRPPEDGAK